MFLELGVVSSNLVLFGPDERIMKTIRTAEISHHNSAFLHFSQAGVFPDLSSQHLSPTQGQQPVFPQPLTPASLSCLDSLIYAGRRRSAAAAMRLICPLTESPPVQARLHTARRHTWHGWWGSTRPETRGNFPLETRRERGERRRGRIEFLR